MHHTTTVDQSRPPGGFTLIEIIIVLVVMSLVTMIAVPSVKSLMGNARVSAAAAAVAEALEFARLTAITTGVRTRVVVYAATDTVTVERYERGKLEKISDPSLSVISDGEVEDEALTPMQLPMHAGVNYVVATTNGGRYGDADITLVDFGSTNAVEFGVGGVPTSSGVVSLVSGDYQKTVAVLPVTGRIVVSD